jgi:transposase InsO family protein
VYALRSQHKVVSLCRVLKVNRSTYYKHFSGILSKREPENQGLRSGILVIYNQSGQKYGVLKVGQRLVSECGITISAGRVYRLMKSMDLPGRRSGRPPKQRGIKGKEEILENKLNRKFNPDKPNRVWVSDFTYVKVNGHWRYVCVVIDLFARMIVG